MTTTISIIDKPGSKLSEESNVRLLWTGMLICESVSSSCEVVTLLKILTEYDLYREKDKLRLYLSWLKKNPEFEVESARRIENHYSELVRVRKLKGKNKEAILIQMQAEKLFKSYFEHFRTAILNFCGTKNTLAFLPLTTRNTEGNWDKPLLPWIFPNKESEDETRSLIHLLSKTLTDIGTFPFFDSEIKYSSISIDMNGEVKQDETHFISEYLFEIPEPITLTTSQLNLVRNDLSKVSSNLFSELKTMYSSLKDIPFAKNNFEQIRSLFREKIAPLKSTLQKTVDEVSCFKELKNENPDGKIYRIYAAITSFATLVDFYKTTEIIGVSEHLYICEDLATRVPLTNSRLFLMLEEG